MGGSLGKSKSSSGNQFSNGVWGTQGNALGSLYQSVLKQLGGNNLTDKITGAAGDLGNKINGIIDSSAGANKDLAAGGVYGDTADIRQKLLDSMGGRSNMGSMYESIVGGKGNTYVDPLIDQMRKSSAQNVQTLQGGNAVDAAAMGQSGSSRQAMQDAMFANQANKDLLGTEAQLRSDSYDKDLSMKMGIAGMADSNKQSEQDRLLQMMQGAQGSKEGASTNTNLLSTLLQGGLSPWLQAQQAMWNPINNAANAIGAPTITGSGSGSSKSKGFGTSGSLWG